jgi:putative ABC transport system permease protein
VTPQIIAIGSWQLLFSLIFVLLAGAASLTWHLGLGRSLLVGTLRTFAQLALMGYALVFIFRLESATLTLGVFGAMILAALQIVHGRIKAHQVSLLWPMFGAMLVSYAVVTVVVTGVIVGAKPWWQPQYFIPIAGMIIGNSMNALAISLERLFSDLRSQRDLVEMHLCLGADAREASQTIVRGAIRAGMIPSINAMMGVGIVFLPGMMTGQILSGVDPLTAIRYQIVVMVMLVGSTALSTVAVVLLARRRCFGSGDRLLLRAGWR